MDGNIELAAHAGGGVSHVGYAVEMRKAPTMEGSKRVKMVSRDGGSGGEGQAITGSRYRSMRSSAPCGTCNAVPSGLKASRILRSSCNSARSSRSALIERR